MRCVGRPLDAHKTIVQQYIPYFRPIDSVYICCKILRGITEKRNPSPRKSAKSSPQRNRADAAVATVLRTLLSLPGNAFEGSMEQLVRVEHETDRPRPILAYLQ